MSILTSPTPNQTTKSKYRQPAPSPIEQSFWKVAKDAIPELEREVWIGSYRVDFLVKSRHVVIELYGFRWHHTRDKLTHDAERERFLQRQGYHVIRFTGTEVHRDPRKCVQDVLEIIRQLPASNGAEPRSASSEASRTRLDAYGAVAPPLSEGNPAREGYDPLLSSHPSPLQVDAARRRGARRRWLGLRPKQLQVLFGLLVLNLMVLVFAAIVVLQMSP